MTFRLLAVIVLLAACAAPPPPSPSPSPSQLPSVKPSGSANPACQDFSHVYHPDRLKVLAPCATVTGTIEVIRHEPDGDDHILVKLDPGQDKYLNAVNVSAQHGDLIAEPVCEHTVTQADAVSACPAGYKPVPVPPVGSHVVVTGPWVLDQQHSWQEIHPASFVIK